MIAEFDDSRPLSASPEGMGREERIVWQGAPDWRSLALRSLRMREVAAYFLLIMAWRFGAEIAAGNGLVAALSSGGWPLALGLPVLGFLGLYARLVARSTLYTVTTERLVLRIGVALPMTVTVPLALVQSLNLRLNPDRTGDITIAVLPEQRLSYVVLWPHARPWRIGRPEAALRAVPNAEAVSIAISRVLARQAGQVEPAALAGQSAPASGARDTSHTTGSLASAAG